MRMDYVANWKDRRVGDITKYLNRILEGKAITGYEMRKYEPGLSGVQITVRMSEPMPKGSLVGIDSKMQKFGAVRMKGIIL